MAVNYVKFQRGTIANYNGLKAKGLLDSNTLYFVYETTASSQGALYLGSKQIGGVGSGTSITKLSQLTDVIADNVEAGAFLVSNADGNWEAQTLAQVATLIANSIEIKADENTFNFTPVTGGNQLNLLGFDSAENGSYAMKGVNGKLTWYKPETDFADLSTKVGTLEEKYNGIDSKIAEAASKLNHLTYKKVDSLDQANEDNTIYLVKKATEGENDLYSEYMYIDGALEHLGTFNNGDLSDYVTKSTFDTFKGNVEDYYLLKTSFSTTVGDLSQIKNYTAGNSLVDEINNIYERLIWEEIPADNT